MISKGEKQFNVFDERIISLYSRGLTVRDIQAHFQAVYGVEVSGTCISQVTNEVMEEVKAWPKSPLEALYPIVYLDCIVVKSQDSGVVINKSVYLALGINIHGEKELLGVWIAKSEGATFWLSVMTALKNRGLQDIFVACCDGLKGFPEAIEALYPQTRVQLCLVHPVRHSLCYVHWKERKAVAADLRALYGAATVEQADSARMAFSAKWDKKYPTMTPSWRNNWERLIVIFDFAPEIRQAIYTTNAIESLNAALRKVTKTRRVFPTDESVLKLLYLALHNISAKWTMPIKDWKPAMSQFMLMYGDRHQLTEEPFTQKILQTHYSFFK